MSDADSTPADLGASAPERSAAYRNYERNLDTVELVLELLGLKFRAFRQEVTATFDTAPLTAVKQMIQERGVDAKEDAVRLMTEFQARIAGFRVEKELELVQEARQTLDRWIAVMLVTFVETYLQDVTAEVARSEPEIMNNMKQAADYDDVINSAGIPELAEELRSRWACNFTDDGGPRKWASRLAKRGAGEYDSEAVATMERLWGVQHVVIHNAGRANYGFIRRHKSAGVAVGDLVPITHSDVSGWLTAIGSFVDQTDKHFVGYLKGKGQASVGSSPGT